MKCPLSAEKHSQADIGAEKGVFSTLTIPGDLAEKKLSCFNQYVALEIN